MPCSRGASVGRLRARSRRLLRRRSQLSSPLYMVAAVSETVRCAPSRAQAAHLRRLTLPYAPRLNDEGSTAFNASKLPCIDQSAVMSFLAGGLRPAALAAHLRTGEISADGLAGRTAALRSCCEELLTAVPVTVSSTFVRAQSTMLATDSQHGHAPRLCTFAQVAYTCFLCAPGDATTSQPALGILRSDAMARDNTTREGTLVRFSPGDRIVDLQFYRDARLVVLVCDEHGASRFDTIACDQLRYMPLDDTAGALAAGASLRAERLCTRSATHRRDSYHRSMRIDCVCSPCERLGGHHGGGRRAAPWSECRRAACSRPQARIGVRVRGRHARCPPGPGGR